MGCDTAQGWHVGKPVAAGDLTPRFAEEARRAA
jgi:hypothetical protein